MMNQSPFKLHSAYVPTGDQPEAIDSLVANLEAGVPEQILLGVTGSGKTFTMANVIARCGRPALVLAPNKTLAAQLYNEFREFFPQNAVEYFVSYYDYYQPEAYVPASDTYIEKDSSINDNIDKLRHAATHALLTRRDVIIVASVSCIYGLGSPEFYARMIIPVEVGQHMSMDALITRLVEVQYERNDYDFHRGTFRVRGDVLEIIPAYHHERALRIEFFGDDIDSMREVDPLTGDVLAEVGKTVIYPASHFVSAQDNLKRTTADIRQELLEKGFPERVLNDLTADEVAQLSGAVRVYHQTERLYSNTDYREVTLSRFLRDPPHTLQYDHTLTETDDAGNRTYRYVYRVYDTLEQTMTHVAVELPEEDGVRRYIYIHHLTYAAPPSPYTEMLELWPAWQTQGDWFPGGHVSGRVLCERNGTAQAAAFHTLKSGSQQVSDLFGTRQTQRITAGWSFPRGVESPRAYVFYDALRGQDGWVIESWANYVCQTAPVYPFRDAAALWHSYGSDAYSLRQTALQVFDG